MKNLKPKFAVRFILKLWLDNLKRYSMSGNGEAEWSVPPRQKIMVHRSTDLSTNEVFFTKNDKTIG